jgi:hypothetical protein
LVFFPETTSARFYMDVTGRTLPTWVGANDLLGSHKDVPCNSSTYDQKVTRFDH